MNLPHYSKRFFEWFCDPELYEELQGDLTEQFLKNETEFGPAYARWVYRKEILFMLRPSVIKNAEWNRISTPSVGMLDNYIKTAFRNLKRSWLFSSINILGFSLSLTVGIIIITAISYSLSFDQFHADKDHIYRITTSTEDSYFGVQHYATTDLQLFEILDSYPELFDQVVRINSSFEGEAITDSKQILIDGLYVDASFNDLFSFRLLTGNPDKVLDQPFSIVLTPSTAERLFDHQNPIGQSIEIPEKGIFQVTGIIKEPPKNSHLQFNSLVSFSTLELLQASLTNESLRLEYNYIYFKKDPNADLTRIQRIINSEAEQYSAQLEGTNISYSSQPLTSIVPGPALLHQIGPEIESIVLIILSILVGIIILSTCFNYTNLSIARALKRTKEVALRKTLGGSRFQIFLQFITEAVIYSVIALGFALFLFEIVKPGLLRTLPEIGQLLSFELTPKLIIYYLIFAVSVGILAGFLPSFLLSKQQILELLKGAGQIKLFRFVNLRKALIISQFTVSLICIIFATIVVKQFNFSQQYDMGFEKDDILNVRLFDADPELFQSSISDIPEIKQVSLSSALLGVGGREKIWLRNNSRLDSIYVDFMAISPGFIDNHEIPLVAGRSFRQSDSEMETLPIVVNQTFIKEFGFENISETVGQTILGENGQIFSIVGIVEDFNFDRLREPIRSFFFLPGSDQFTFANLSLQSSDPTMALAKLEQRWKKLNSPHPFTAEMFNERIKEAYSFFILALKFVGAAALLTISIALMGLLGIVIYTSESRTNEIGVRKVYGANEANLVILLSSSFLKMMFAASLIAVLLTYTFFNFVVLPNETHSAPLGFWDFAIGVIIIFTLGLSAVITQTLKVAGMDPVEAIRRE